MIERPLSIMSGEALFQEAEPDRPIIDGLLYEEDILLLQGSEKSGKSILAMQMAFNITTGGRFLDKYPVSAPMDILYIQTEGKPSETQDNRLRMRQMVTVDSARCFWVYQKFFLLDHEANIKRLIELLDDANAQPKVIFVDSLYSSVSGDLNKNEVPRKLGYAITPLLERSKAALVLLHHLRKAIIHEGKALDEGDKGTFGSTFWRAWVSHILNLRMNADKTRVLSMETSRSGFTMNKEPLILVGRPKTASPLYFTPNTGAFTPASRTILDIVRQAGRISRQDIVSQSGLAEKTVEACIGVLMKNGNICRFREGRVSFYEVGI